MVTQQSLPLFQPEREPEVGRLAESTLTVPLDPAASVTAACIPAGSSQIHVERGQNRGQTSRHPCDAGSISSHLVAARRLSKKIRYLPDHSDVQTRTGQAICQHLRLMLNEKLNDKRIQPPIAQAFQQR